MEDLGFNLALSEERPTLLSQRREKEERRTMPTFQEMDSSPRVRSKVEKVRSEKIERNVESKNLKAKEERLKREHIDKLRRQKYSYQTASPLKSSFSNAFGSSAQTLSRRGYTSKEIKMATQRNAMIETNRKKKLRTVNRAMNVLWS
jgi:hypothetical protein